jgi:hypothetical protein
VRGETPAHGTTTRYRQPKYQCRCKKCTKAHREACLEYMRTHPEQVEAHAARARDRHKLNKLREQAATA